jgi:hypothetical protein
MSGCSTTSDCCEPCGNGTHAPCGVCSNGICEGVPVAQPRPHD